MSTSETIIDLLRDARLLSDFAGRRGVLPNNSLPTAIANIQNKMTSKSVSSQDEQELLASLNEAVKSIGYVSFNKLRAIYVWSEKDIDKMTKIRWLRQSFTRNMVMCVCAIIMIIVIPLTTYFNRISIAVSEMKEVESSKYFEQLEDLKETSDNKISSAIFMEKLAILRQIDGKIKATTTIAIQSGLVQRATPNIIHIIKESYDFRESNKTDAPAHESPAAASGQITTVHQNINNPPMVEWPQSSITQPSIPQSGELPTENSPSPNPTQPSDRSKPNNSMKEIGIFAVEMGLITSNPVDFESIFFMRRNTENAILFLGGSVLPILYGLLGSGVYLMRVYLGKSYYDPFVQSVESPAILRLGLGGIAGLAIGWFWIPDAAAKLTTAPFALAFLAGFSIEVLFAILDRIILALSAPPASPEGTR